MMSYILYIYVLLVVYLLQDKVDDKFDMNYSV